jgi:hypothetical protein
MCQMVAAVPRIQQRGDFDSLGSALAVLEAALELLGRKRLQQHDPARVDILDDGKRPFGRRGNRVVQLCQGFLVIAGNHWPFLRQGESDAEGRNHVAVGDVAKQLPDGPAAVPIWGVELVGVQAVDGIAQMRGQFGDAVDGIGEFALRQRTWCGPLELAYGEAWVGCRLRMQCGNRAGINTHGIKRSTIDAVERDKMNVGLRVAGVSAMLLSLGLTGCNRSDAETSAATGSSVDARPAAMEHKSKARANFVGFDRNGYPGDDRLRDLRQHFDFVGYWLTIPPGAKMNGWLGKRAKLRDEGFGFLVLANGRVEAEIKRARLSPDAMGKQDAALAIATARAEGFPDKAILFLDQEEGGRLTLEQAGYFFGWTEAVAASRYVSGAYVSGQPVPDGTGPNRHPLTVTTAQDVREHIVAQHLHTVTLWVAQDACPPAPGCVVQPPRLQDSGTAGAEVWQYAQSPRRPNLTRSCAKTYAADNQCYGGVTTDLVLDLDVAASADPSHGR